MLSSEHLPGWGNTRKPKEAVCASVAGKERTINDTIQPYLTVLTNYVQAGCTRATHHIHLPGETLSKRARNEATGKKKKNVKKKIRPIQKNEKKKRKTKTKPLSGASEIAFWASWIACSSSEDSANGAFEGVVVGVCCCWFWFLFLFRIFQFFLGEKFLVVFRIFECFFDFLVIFGLF